MGESRFGFFLVLLGVPRELIEEGGQLVLLLVFWGILALIEVGFCGKYSLKA
jgi:hypothetical protein